MKMEEPEIIDPYCDPSNPRNISFEQICSAAYRIKSGIRNTECVRSEHLSNLTGMNIYVKKEFLQATGSFKERGARFTMMMLPPEMKRKGIVAASAGNHAQACCYHGTQLGIPVTVFMPENAPIMKIQKCVKYGGNVVVKGKDLAESKRLALEYGRDNGVMYLNGYDHPQVLAGQGSIGLEIWEQVPNLNAVVIPTGGGGLLAGVCVAIKSLDPNIKIIGVEPERAACLKAAMEHGKPTNVAVESTLADGLAVAKLGVNAFECVKNIIDKYVVVKEQYIALAILRLIEYEKCVVEGAGASSLAAILQGLVPELLGKTVCLILSGGNIDTTVLGRTMERGLAADGRLVKVTVQIPERVTGLMTLVNTISEIGVHIRDIEHERAWVTSDIFMVAVKVVCECRDREHSLELRDGLLKQYGTINFNGIEYPTEGLEVSNIFAPLTQQIAPVAINYENAPFEQKIIDMNPLTGNVKQEQGIQVYGPQPVDFQTIVPQSFQQEICQTIFQPQQPTIGEYGVLSSTPDSPPSATQYVSVSPQQEGSAHLSQKNEIYSSPGIPISSPQNIGVSLPQDGSGHISQTSDACAGLCTSAVEPTLPQNIIPPQQQNEILYPIQQTEYLPPPQQNESPYPTEQVESSYLPISSPQNIGVPLPQDGSGHISQTSDACAGLCTSAVEPMLPQNIIFPQQQNEILYPIQQTEYLRPPQQNESPYPTEQVESSYLQQQIVSPYPQQQDVPFFPLQQDEPQYSPQQIQSQFPEQQQNGSSYPQQNIPQYSPQQNGFPNPPQQYVTVADAAQQVTGYITIPVQVDIGITRPNCTCKMRGAPGDYVQG